MRVAPLVALLGFAGIATAQEARFDVLVKGKKAGLATYRVGDRKGGGRLTRLRIVLADGSISENLSESDANGAAVRAENTVRRGSARTKETITYNFRGDATLAVDRRKPSIIPFKGRGSRKDPSELWFRSVKPSGNTWAIFLALNPRKQTWEQVKVTFVGKRGMGNLVRQEREGVTTSFTLDDHGIPLVIESGDLRMVRR